jgi:hypothetical protein
VNTGTGMPSLCASAGRAACCNTTRPTYGDPDKGRVLAVCRLATQQAEIIHQTPVAGGRERVGRRKARSSARATGHDRVEPGGEVVGVLGCRRRDWDRPGGSERTRSFGRIGPPQIAGLRLVSAGVPFTPPSLLFLVGRSEASASQALRLTLRQGAAANRRL